MSEVELLLPKEKSMGVQQAKAHSSEYSIKVTKY